MHGSPQAPADLRAVLFDMDGTLVETEQYWGEALAALADRLGGRRGGRLSPAARAATVGSSMRTAMGILHADLGVVRTDAQVRGDARWVEDATAELMHQGISWRPGARELLVSVRAAGLGTALVTTTSRRLAGIVLRRIAADLGEDPFHLTVCGDEVPARKPDPAPYLQALAGLRRAASECVVIEDSHVGVTAGLAAGVVVLGVPTMQTLIPAPRLVLRDTLEGVGPGDLAALHAEAHGGVPATVVTGAVRT